jgi:hypothetical protein
VLAKRKSYLHRVVLVSEETRLSTLIEGTRLKAICHF